MDANSRARKAVENRQKAKATATNTTRIYSNGQKSITTPVITNFSQNPRVETTIHGSVAYDSAISFVNVSLPGFERSSLDDIAANVYSPDLTKISDVKNPEIKNQVTVAEYENAKAQYEGGIRYNGLIVWANKYAGSQFKALAEKAKAFASGLVAQSEIEKVYQQFLELQKQQKITLDKGVDYISQSHKTAVKQAMLPYTLAESEAVLSKQKSKAEKAFHEAKQAQLDTSFFIKSLGDKSLKSA